jgi:hypothetical protein
MSGLAKPRTTMSEVQIAEGEQWEKVRLEQAKSNTVSLTMKWSDWA